MSMYICISMCTYHVRIKKRDNPRHNRTKRDSREDLYSAAGEGAARKLLELGAERRLLSLLLLLLQSESGDGGEHSKVRSL